jgi:hypothetical protein
MCLPWRLRWRDTAASEVKSTGAQSSPAKPRSRTTRPKEIVMVLTAAHISPLVALIAGILILVVPQLLNYVVAIYLIVVGLVGLNDIYHFVT